MCEIVQLVTHSGITAYSQNFLSTMNQTYEGGSICNENTFITPSINALEVYAICQTKDQSLAVMMVYETLFHLSKFNKLQTFLKITLIYTAYIFLQIVKMQFNKGRKACLFSKTNI